MEKLFQTVDIIDSPEKPVNTTLFVLPQVDVDGTIIRFSMHTDNILGLMRALNSLPPSTKDSLKIEGRAITAQQFEELEKHPAYRFFMRGRIHRAQHSVQQDILTYIFPDNLGLDSEQLMGLLSFPPFSPSTLSNEIGFTATWYSAQSLVETWKQEHCLANFLIPLFGGANELILGSDTIPVAELEQIAREIRRKIEDEQFGPLNLKSAQPLGNFPGYTKAIISKPFQTSIKLDFNYAPTEKIKSKTPIDNWINGSFIQEKLSPQKYDAPKKKIKEIPNFSNYYDPNDFKYSKKSREEGRD